MDRSSRQSTRKQWPEMKHRADRLDRFVQKIPSKSKRTHILFNFTWNFLKNKPYMLRHQTSLSKFKKNEIISSIFSNHSGMKLKINYKKKAGKITNMWRMNNILLNNYWINEEIKGENLKYWKTNENENTTYQNL